MKRVYSWNHPFFPKCKQTNKQTNKQTSEWSDNNKPHTIGYNARTVAYDNVPSDIINKQQQ
jgi:hypothetical protein